MLVRASGMSDEDLAAVAGLERRVLEVDGGRLKLEWATLRSRSGAQVEDLLWRSRGDVRGFLGLYRFGPTVEIAGMVDPTARRAGIATALLDAATALLRERGVAHALLVVPGASVAGHALARARGGVLDHSEHALVLPGDPAPGPADPRTALRTAGPADAPVVGALLGSGFGGPQHDLAEQLAGGPERILLVEHDGAPVGTVRLTRDGDTGGVYGFVVAPEHQGRGIGRDVLRRVCAQLLAEGASRVGLEVAVDNERALGLYTSLGFTPVSTEDYYAVPVR